MIVKLAKEIARQWVLEAGSKTPGFYGAFYHGSTNWLSEEADLPATSDLDIMVVLSGSVPSNKLGKFPYYGVLLEVSYLPIDQIPSAEQVLSNYHLAGSFHVPSIILDPSEKLTELQIAVSRDYARSPWVYKRCEHARNNVLNGIQRLNEAEAFHDQVTACVFAAGVTTHILLVAGLKNPTVRRRYVAVKELLAEYSFSDFYESLLELLGCTHMSRESVEGHLAALEEVFDITKAVIKTPYQFAADLSDRGRPVVIEGSREMIEQGYHREAIFWMVATYSRCMSVIHQDASLEVQQHCSHGYRHLLADLGIHSFTDLQQRGEQIRQLIPSVWEIAEAIMAANPERTPTPGPSLAPRKRGVKSP